jgi:ankyrin repeat protein
LGYSRNGRVGTTEPIADKVSSSTYFKPVIFNGKVVYYIVYNTIVFYKEDVSVDTGINGSDQNGFTRLMTAVNRYDIGAVRSLVEAGADVNKINTNGQNVLMMACYNDDFDIVKYFIGLNFDLDVKDYHGKTAYMLTSDKRIKNVLQKYASK